MIQFILTTTIPRGFSLSMADLFAGQHCGRHIACPQNMLCKYDDSIIYCPVDSPMLAVVGRGITAPLIGRCFVNSGLLRLMDVCYLFCLPNVEYCLTSRYIS